MKIIAFLAKKKYATLSVIVLVLMVGSGYGGYVYAKRTNPYSIQAYFSPLGGCTKAVVAAIDAAKKSIYVQAYSFTSEPIAQALVRAHERGVDVHAILDKSQRLEQSQVDEISDSGVEALIDAKHAIAHNKVMIIDGIVVLTGSFNFSESAEKRNAENLLVIRDRKLAARYQKNWDLHKEHVEAYVMKKKPVKKQ